MHTLWLLLLVIAIVMGTSLIGRRAADNITAYETRLRLDLAAESAIYDAVFELLEQGTQSRWVRDHGKVRTLYIDEQTVDLAVTNVHGIVDINTADQRLLERLLANLPGIDVPAVIAGRIQVHKQNGKEDNRLTTYSDLSAILSLSLEDFACLYPYITLFSGRLEPSAALTSDRLKKMIGQAKRDEEQLSAMEGGLSVAGEVFRITAAVHSDSPKTNRLSAEVLLTGRRDMPYLIRSWIWVPNCEAQT
ncbi:MULTISPECIES: hypothetical protein [unclassified Methylocaldum]|uniref:hypothetical protein n=1 Tax=unclassified Methylocaldum TaxID=2622260 RepID=UPI001AE3B7AB|nr:hypothetical protein [Methylocaldum sp. RMAD-M]